MTGDEGDRREAREEGLYSMKGLPQRDWAHDDEGETARRGPRPSHEEPSREEKAQSDDEPAAGRDA